MHALGDSQSQMNVKYSSPSCFTSNRPALVPTSSGRSSSGRFTMVAPVARAMRLLSVFRMRRMHEMPARPKWNAAISASPFSVMTTSGFTAMMAAHVASIHSSSILRSVAKSSSFKISTFVWFSPFLYSSGQSKSRMRGFSMRRRMRPGVTTSLLNMTPRSTVQSSIAPPGIFSTFAYFFKSISLVPSPRSTTTHCTASSASSAMSGPKRDVYFVPMQLFTRLSIALPAECPRQL